MVHAEDLTKTFTVHRKAGMIRRRPVTVHAVEGLSFDVGAGEMVGYIGPNGAGKSTTVKMLTGLLYPSAGTVRVAGLEPARQRKVLARQIGVVFGQRRQLLWDLPLLASLDLFRHVYRIPGERYRHNLDTFVELLELQSFLETPVRQLSLGQVMRGELAATLIHDPDVLFLDEPTIGLDVVSKGRVLDFLATMNRERGTTMLITTHDVADLERLCRRMLIIDHGHLIYDGTMTGLRARMGTERTLVVDLEQPRPALVIECAETVSVEGRRQRLRFSRDRTSAAALIAEVARAAPVADLAVEEVPIEDIVRRIYEGGLEG